MDKNIIISSLGLITSGALITSVILDKKSEDTAYVKLSNFLNGYNDTVDSITKDIISTHVSESMISYDEVVKDILKSLNIFSDKFSSVPTFLNKEKKDLILSLKNEMDEVVVNIINSYVEKWNNFIEEVFLLKLDSMFIDLKQTFEGLLEDIEEDIKEEMAEYYSKISSDKKKLILESIPVLMSNNIKSREERITGFYEIISSGITSQYGRLITTGKLIQNDFLLTNQAKNYIENEIQESIVNIMDRDLEFSIILSSPEEQIEFRSLNFETANETRTSIQSEISFRSEKNHIPRIIENRASDVFIARFKRIENDSILSDDQKTTLKEFAQSSYTGLVENLENSNKVYESSEMEGYAFNYLQKILPKVNAYMESVFSEFSSILNRAKIEGSISCHTQFFQLRRSMDDHLFFEIAKQEEFDIESTKSKFWEMYDNEMEVAREKMIQFVRLDRISIIYDDSINYLSALLSLFFYSDSLILDKMNSFTYEFHEKLADIVGNSIEEGIEEVFENEKNESKEIVTQVFDEFIENIKVGQVSFMISEMMDIVKEEVNAKFDYIQSEIIPGLVTEFRSSTIEPFNFTWMEEVQKQYVTGEGITDIDFNGMRIFTVKEMNKLAEFKVDEYIGLVNELSDVQIISIGDSMDPFIEMITTKISESEIDDIEKEALMASLSSTKNDALSFLNSVKTSLVVFLNSLIQVEIESMDKIMDETTQSFFDTTQQVIVEQFIEWANNETTNIWNNSITDLVDTQKQLAQEAKETFRSHIFDLVSLELDHRKQIESSSNENVKLQAENVLQEYDIVSYGYNKFGIRDSIVANVQLSISELRNARNSDIRELNQEYSIKTILFRRKYTETGQQKITDFNKIYSGTITKAYERFSDILNIDGVSSALKQLEGPTRKSLTEQYNTLVSNSISNFENDLPIVNMTNICYPYGLIQLADKEEDDLQSIMEPYLLEQQKNLDGQEFEDDENVEDEEDLPEQTGILTHDNIAYSMADYDSWFDGIMEKAIEDMEAEIDEGLRENTCNNKPTCGTSECSDTELSCREHYSLVRNQYGVMCCKFDPSSDVKSNIPALRRLIFEEICIMVLTDPSFYTFTAKGASVLASSVGKNLAKFTRVQNMLTKISASGKNTFAKANAYVGRKVANKTGFKFGKQIGKSLATKFGTVTAKTALKNVVITGALKKLGKSLASGPFAAAMFAFDAFSLLLDIVDPHGYNDVDSLENIATFRDMVLSYYNAALEAEGIKAPMVSNTLYNIDPEKQGEFVYDLFMEWYTNEINLGMSANEEKWSYMSNSAALEDYFAMLAEIGQKSEDDSFIPKLIFENTEDTILVRASSTVGTDPSIIGTDSDPDYDSVNKRHRLVVSLNEIGVEKSNNFNKIKTEFMNILVKQHMYRWVKLENGYRVYQKLSTSEKDKAEREINRRRRLRSTGDISEEELNSIVLYKAGWILERVDPEVEFWIQHRYKQENGNDEYQSTENFYKVWEWLHEQNKTDYETRILTTAEEILKADYQEALETEGENTMVSPGPFSIEFIKNDPVYNKAKEQVDSNIQDLMEEEKEQQIESEELEKRQNEARDELTAKTSEGKLSIEEAKLERIKVENTNAFVELEQDFSVFKDGYGQVSPLLNLVKRCQDMEYGITFSSDTGLCNFTKPYCKRYGLDFKYNKEYGAYDCNLSGHQRVLESVFGTTIVRTFRGGGSREGHLKALKLMFPLAYGAEYVVENYLLGTSKSTKSTKNVPKTAVEIYRALDNIGLGSSYGI